MTNSIEKNYAYLRLSEIMRNTNLVKKDKITNFYKYSYDIKLICGSKFVGICKGNNVLIDFFYTIFEIKTGFTEDILSIIAKIDNYNRLPNHEKSYNILFDLVGLYDETLGIRYLSIRDNVRKKFCKDRAALSLRMFLLIETSEKIS